MDCLLFSLRHLFQLHLFWLEDGYFENREGRLKWSCRNDLSPYLLTAASEKPKQNLPHSSWYEHSAVFSSVLARSRSVGDLQGLLLHWEVRSSVALMGPGHPYLPIACNGKPAVPGLVADNLLSRGLLPLLVQICVLSALVILVSTSRVSVSVSAFAQDVVPKSATTITF